MATFQKPSSTSDKRFAEVQDNILKVQNEILTLTAAVAEGSGSGSSQQWKAHFSTLENDFQRLRQQIADERRESTTANGELDAAINALTNQFNTMEIRIDSLQSSIEQKAQEEAKMHLPARIIDEIKCHNFSSAESMIAELNDNKKIHKIVHDVYSNCVGNFGLLMDFAKAITKSDICWFVLNALRYEMHSNGHRDPYKMISLVESFETKILNAKNVDEKRKDAAKNDIDETIADIKTVVTESLKTALFADNYQKNLQIQTLTEAILHFRKDVSNEIMQRIVVESYGTVLAVKIADNIYSNTYMSQIIAGLTALFRELKKNDDLNNKAVLNIGRSFKKLMAMASYKNVLEEQKQSVQNIIDELPYSAKNLLFSKTVLIRNRATGKYLYVAGYWYIWQNKRSVCIWTSPTKKSEEYWYVEQSGDQFCFQSKLYSNEYMSAADEGMDSIGRYVITWMPGGKMGSKSDWDIELEGDYCYIKNTHFDEYMYSSTSEYTLTWKQKTSPNGKHSFQWKIMSAD